MGRAVVSSPPAAPIFPKYSKIPQRESDKLVFIVPPYYQVVVNSVRASAGVDINMLYG
jgi:hypothetical protein